jgi:hypothetical protein
MKGIRDILAADITGEWEIGKYTGSRTTPTHDEIAQVAFGLYEARGGEDGREVEDGCARNRNSCGTTPNGEVRTNNHDALKSVDQRKVNS